jgi:hypothetical protein
MIIENIPFVSVSDGVSYTMSACLAMILRYYESGITDIEVNDMFGHTLLSDDFYTYFNNSLDTNAGITQSEVIECANFMLNKYFKNLNSSIIHIDITSIRYSFIKRNIPIILPGLFPLSSGYIPGSVVVKGYVGDYLVVNDPRGDAISGYKDKNGENHIYPLKDIIKWVRGNTTHILRVMPRV